MSLPDLLKMLNTYFDLNEIQNLCFEINVDYDNLGGNNKLDKCRELITYLQRRGRLDELIEVCLRERPNIPWDDLIKTSGSS